MIEYPVSDKLRGIFVINIFPESNTKKKVKRKTRKKGLSDGEKIKLGKERLQSLDPMVIPMLAVKVKEQPNNEFLTSSIAVVMDRPHKLSEKWIVSLNKWSKSLSDAIMLDEPDVEVGKRPQFDNMIIGKICDPNAASEFPMPAIICIDERGWKWYFKTSKAYSFAAGDTISFVATVSSHKEGITFLRRPSKITKAIKIHDTE